MLYHYTFQTYMGKPLLEDEGLVKYTKQLFLDIAKEKGFKIVESEILVDHVHILIDQNYTLSSSMVMKFLKGISSRKLLQQYEASRGDLRKLWAQSFHARKISNREREKVINYIRGQKDAQGIDKRY